jgi:hypothetical protein
MDTVLVGGDHDQARPKPTTIQTTDADDINRESESDKMEVGKAEADSDMNGFWKSRLVRQVDSVYLKTDTQKCCALFF